MKSLLADRDMFGSVVIDSLFYIYGLKHVLIDTQDDPLATIYSKWHDNVYVSAFTKAEFSKLLKYVARVVCCTSIVMGNKTIEYLNPIATFAFPPELFSTTRRPGKNY